MTRDRRGDALLAGAAVTLTRVPFLVSCEQDLDGSRFVRALLRVDLSQGHPHPPGYPLYLALGALVRALVGDPASALSWVSALSSGVLAAATFALASRCSRDRAVPWLAVALLCGSTVVAVHSTRPLSDMMGSALAWCVVLAAVSRRPVWSSVAMALLLGTRWSAAPLAAVAWWFVLRTIPSRRTQLAHVAAALTAGAALHLPLVALTGASRFVALVLDHGAGHFTRYGGSVATQPDVWLRARSLAFGAWAQLLGGCWTDRPRWMLPGTALLLVTGWFATRTIASRPGWERAVVGWSCAVYALWAALGQNVVWQPRHLLPLAPGVAIALALAGEGRRAWVAALAALQCAATVPLLWTQASAPPPTLAVARWLSSHDDPSRVVVTCQLATWLRYRAPGARVVSSCDRAEVSRVMSAAPGHVWWTSDVPTDARCREVVRVTNDRYVTSTLYDVALCRP